MSRRLPLSGAGVRGGGERGRERGEPLHARGDTLRTNHWGRITSALDDQGEGFSITSDPNQLVAVRKAVQAAGLDYESAEVLFVPSFFVVVQRLEEWLGSGKKGQTEAVVSEG